MFWYWKKRMKVIDPAVFGVNHPSTWEVDEKHIGRSKNKLVIVKNFFTNPDDLRMYACLLYTSPSPRD